MMAVQFCTTCGHLVLVDADEWPRLSALIAAGARVQSQMMRNAVRVTLRQYAGPGGPGFNTLLSRVILGAGESQRVAMLNGPLDHRRESMQLMDDGRRIGWALGVKRGPRNAA